MGRDWSIWLDTSSKWIVYQYYSHWNRFWHIFGQYKYQNSKNCIFIFQNYSFSYNVIKNLHGTEFQILQLLASHPGWVFTRYQIIDKIRGDNYSVTDRSIDFQIVGLRKKMSESGSLIQTIRGVGYRFKAGGS